MKKAKVIAALLLVLAVAIIAGKEINRKAGINREIEKINSTYTGKDLWTTLTELEEKGYTVSCYDISVNDYNNGGKLISRDALGTGPLDESYLKKATVVQSLEPNPRTKHVPITFMRDPSVEVSNEPIKPKTTASSTPTPMSISSFDVDDVWWKLQQHGEALYPYGFDIHHLSTSEIKSDDSWEFSCKVTVTNSSGTDRDTFLYATVSESGSIESFEVY